MAKSFDYSVSFSSRFILSLCIGALSLSPIAAFAEAGDAAAPVQTTQSPESGNAAAAANAAAQTGTAASASPGQSAPGAGAASAQANEAASAETDSVDAAAADQSEKSDAALSMPKKWQKGQELSVGTTTDDLVPTDDVQMAQKQVQAYPDSPEASFILAVALTRTSRVEDALKEVRRARKLAEQNGGSAYFDKMISTYENMLKDFPNENRVRYGLAWAYYMKAYLLANYSRKVAAWKAANGDPNVALARAAEAAKVAAASKAGGTGGASSASASSTTPNSAAASSASTNSAAANKAAIAELKNAVQPKKGQGLDLNAVMGAVGSIAQGKTDSLPKIPSMTDKVDAQDLPQIRNYFEKALMHLDDLLAQKPDDVWAQVYRAHLKAEYSGNLDEAMKTWTACREKFPNNPAAYFFLGEGYLKQGNLKESLNNVSRAVALRAMGF